MSSDLSHISIDQFFLGSKLGDGAFVKKSCNHNTYVVFKHAADQLDYLSWKFNYLKEHGFIRPQSQGIRRVSLKEGQCFDNFQPQYQFATRSLEQLNKYKDISEDEIVKNFDAGAFAIWALDDGNVYKRCVKIACGSKSIDLSQQLAQKITDVLDIQAKFYQHPSNPVKNYIRIPAKEFSKVEDIIHKFFPKNLDIVEEKFPMTAQSIKIKYFTDRIDPIKQIDGSDWIDLRVAEDVEMEAGEFRLLHLGVAIQLPEGYEAIVAPRSSTYKKWSIILANSIGVIDESYCGDGDEWRFPAIALMDTKIPCNTRICQFRIQKKQPKLNFITVDHLDNPDRGGIGSTGES